MLQPDENLDFVNQKVNTPAVKFQQLQEKVWRGIEFFL